MRHIRSEYYQRKQSQRFTIPSRESKLCALLCLNTAAILHTTVMVMWHMGATNVCWGAHRGTGTWVLLTWCDIIGANTARASSYRIFYPNLKSHKQRYRIDSVS